MRLKKEVSVIILRPRIRDSVVHQETCGTVAIVVSFLLVYWSKADMMVFLNYDYRDLRWVTSPLQHLFRSIYSGLKSNLVVTKYAALYLVSGVTQSREPASSPLLKRRPYKTESVLAKATSFV